MFDAGSIVSTMVLDRTQWIQGMQKVQESVQDAQDRFTRMNKLAQEGVNRVSESLIGMGNAMKAAGHEISRAGTNLAFFGAALSGPILLAFNAMKNVSPQVAEQMQRLTNVTQNFQLQIANAAAPVIEQFVNVLGHLLEAWNALDPALRTQIVQWTLIGGVLATVSGVALVAAGRLWVLSGTLWRAAGSTLAFLGPWGALAAVVLITAAAFGKLQQVIQIVLNGFEGVFSILGLAVQTLNTGLWQVVSGITAAVLGLMELIGRIPGKIGQTARAMTAEIQKFKDNSDQMVQKGFSDMETLAKNVADSFSGKGAITESIMSATDGFQEFIDKILKAANTPIDFKQMQSSLSLMQDSWRRTADAMAQDFSNFFYDAVTGQLKSLKDYFADFGRSVLRILSDVLAKLLITQLFGSISIPGIGQPFNLMAGHAEGIEDVPETGMYRLHRGEKVVPKYDAGKNQQGPLTIVNMVTGDAMASALANSKAGKNVVINIIGQDVARRGTTRQIVRGA